MNGSARIVMQGDDVEHFMCCACMDEEGKQMEKLIEKTVDGWHDMHDMIWRIRRWWWWRWTRIVRVREYEVRVRSCTGGNLLRYN